MILPISISSEINMLLHFFPEDIPQRNTFNGLLFVLPSAGKTMVEVDSRPYILEPGTLLTVLPSHLLHTISCDKNAQCLTLAFTFDSIADFPYMLQSGISERMTCTPYIKLNAEEFDRLGNWYRSIDEHYRHHAHPSYLEILRALLFIFTAEISAIYSNKPIKASASHYEELAEGFFRLLHSYFRTHRETAFYAEKLCISTKYLSKVIALVTGHVPSYWIMDFTIREAKTLLKSTTLTITQLSEKLNFPNSSFFARYFKRHTGLSPQKYRLQ